MTEAPAEILLTEYERGLVPQADFTEENVNQLRSRYSTKIGVVFPSPDTGMHWQFISSGWVGVFPVSKGLHIRVKPKLPLQNLFGMWEYAYQLRGIVAQDDLTSCDSLEGFYSVLARELARRVFERNRRGLAREYVDQRDELPYVKGRLDAIALAQRPWAASPVCDFQDHTADVDDNRLLAWTLSLVSRNTLCSAITLPTVQHAFRELRNTVAIRPYVAHECVNRLYTRLTLDYEPMHALCRFFLENSGPTYQAGQQAVLPFMVEMDWLFELFVAQWLKAHMPDDLELKAQERVSVSGQGEIGYAIDLVIYDRSSGAALCVLDTKYKVDGEPARDDLNQLVVYAMLKHCHHAILIYPTEDLQSTSLTYRDIVVTAVAFDIRGNFEAAGQRFKDKVLTIIGRKV